MSIKNLNLRKAQKHLLKKQNPPSPSGRRKFMKAVGLGVIAWNPVIDSIKTITSRPFQLDISKNNFRFTRNGTVAWSLNPELFEEGFSVKTVHQNDEYRILAHNLKYVNTNLSLDFNARIFSSDGDWLMNIQFPKLGWEQKVDFLRFLDGFAPIASPKMGINCTLFQLNANDRVAVNGNAQYKLYPSWKLSLKGDEAIQSMLSGNIYTTDHLSIGSPTSTELFQITLHKGIEATLTKNRSWGRFMANMQSNTASEYGTTNDQPDAHFLLGINTQDTPIKAHWVLEHNGKLWLKQANFDAPDFEFDRYLYYAEYDNDEDPEFFFSAKLAHRNQWLSNKIGVFGLSGSSNDSDLIACGLGMEITDQVFEPILQAFKPSVKGGVALMPSDQDPIRLKINTSRQTTTPPDTTRQTKKATLNLRNLKKPEKTPERDPERDPQRPTNDRDKQDPQRKPKVPVRFDISTSRKTTPDLQIQENQLQFKPMQAVKIKILRPEDMVFLEFEFHNLLFVHNEQGPFLRLNNEKKKGYIVVYFPTQHTLEEAFFESNQLPGEGTNNTVKLPVRHLRAKKSRLVYEMAPKQDGFPLTLEELLDWSKFKLKVHPRAWIQLPQIMKIIPQQIKIPNIKSSLTPKSYLKEKSKDFSIKLDANSKLKANQVKLYDEKQLNMVLPSEQVGSLKPSFKIKRIKGISLGMGPIPDLNTSIEAPTLMYISPNQINDFKHKIKLELTGADENKSPLQLKKQLQSFQAIGVQKGEIAELWHTRLGVKLQDGQVSVNSLPKLKTIRALWAYDAKKSHETKGVIGAPFMTSLDAYDRQILVHTTSNFGIKGYYPEPVPVKNLMLTNLGAYLDWHAFFDVPSPADDTLNIIEWEHLATLGRDHYVKVVYEGYLFPFGHRAALVKITERKFHEATKSAVNRQRMYVVVLEKEKLYNRENPNGQFIEFPFQAVKIETLSTPNIDHPDQSTLITVTQPTRRNRRSRSNGSSNENTAYNFFINVANKGFKFDLTITDKEGFEHIARMPLVFVDNYVARRENEVNRLIEEYHKDKFQINTEIDFAEQDIAYSESLVDGDTAFETKSLRFGGTPYPSTGAGSILFHPIMRYSKVFIKQVNEITGKREAVEIALEDDDNAGMVFARVKDAVLDFSGGSDKSGGFISPNMAINALSKLQGPVGGDINDMKNLMFNPVSFFEELENLPVAKIFGVINLFDLLLGGVNLNGQFDEMINKVNKIKTDITEIKNEIMYLENQAHELKEDVENKIKKAQKDLVDKTNDLLEQLNKQIPQIPNLKSYVTSSAFYAEYKWQPKFKGTEIGIIPNLLQVDVVNPNTALTITTKLEKPFDPQKPAKMNGLARFEKFTINIIPLLAVKFNFMEFKMGSSEKTDVKVDIDKNDPIKFQGVLSFVNNLQSIIPPTGFSEDGPYIDISPTGVKAGFDISIPSVEVGICMITNISLGASVTLPFTGAPLTMAFNFCRRENPFLLTISCFGGGGFFMMTTTLDGVQSIEAAFEFGAAMSLNVGVASGSVSAMGGFYFKMEIIDDEKETTLTGYLRINGHLSVLGLISLSMEFYLAFNAVIDGNNKVQKLEGVATVKVKIEIAFFSKTVKVTVRRELKGADADPKFIEMIDTDDWQEYCQAFAV